ncbi:MAG: hypothetical protein H7Y59_19130 [Anaerolineales bacterium]|nr:hypothetical protein [Anaerolineales bacterium]
MLLRDNITLSKKHQKSFRVFPYFFRPVLNHFYFLKDDCGFLKPKLDTWKNEGAVEFKSKDIRILIEHMSPNWIGVCFQKINVPGRVYEHRLFEILGIAYDVNLAKVNQSKHYQETEKEIQEIEKAIEKPVEYLSNIIKDNHEKIFSYLKNSSSRA